MSNVVPLPIGRKRDPVDVVKEVLEEQRREIIFPFITAVLVVEALVAEGFLAPVNWR